MQRKLSNRDDSPEWNKMIMSHTMLRVKQVLIWEKQRNIYGIAWVRTITEELREEKYLSSFFSDRREKDFKTFYGKIGNISRENLYHSEGKNCLLFKDLNLELGHSFFAKYLPMPGLILAWKEHFWQLLAKSPITWLNRSFLCNEIIRLGKFLKVGWPLKNVSLYIMFMLS